MTRTVLTDGSNRWFDRAKSESFEEDTYWNGNNMISKATGSQWEHETLYRTIGKKWIVGHTSQWQGSTDTYEEISDQEAAEWLIRNGHEHADVESEIAALEIQ
jgi:hypothetical protein